MSDSGKRFVGKIKSFNSTNGFGFIHCPETESLYGRDIFFNQAVEGGVEVGSSVSFEVTLNPDGRPQARHSVRRFEDRTSNVKEDKVYRGKVRSFNSNQGFGFIECEQAKTQFERDVFLHQQQVNDHNLKVGDTIEFKVHLNLKRQPQSRDITRISSAEGKLAESSSSSPITISKHEDGSMVPPPPGSSRFQGRIRSYNNTQGFGFIASDQALTVFGHQDVFIHKSQLPAKCQPGCNVEFDVQMSKNKPQARNVTNIDTGEEAPVDNSGLSFDLFQVATPS